MVDCSGCDHVSCAISGILMDQSFRRDDFVDLLDALTIDRVFRLDVSSSPTNQRPRYSLYRNPKDLNPVISFQFS